MQEEMILISKAEYESLQEDSLRLSYLEGYGVDNWCGYGDAMDDFYADLTDEDVDDDN